MAPRRGRLLIEYKWGTERRDQIFLSGSHDDLTFIESPSIELVAVDSGIAKKAELRIESANTAILTMLRFSSTWIAELRKNIHPSVSCA